MLGLGNTVVKQYDWSPNSISNLVGWWDFTDGSTMFQERDGTFVTPANSNSDPIGSIQNKARPHVDGVAILNNRIGSYLYASSDSERPALTVHPVGGMFGTFDGTDDHLMCENQSGTVTGGISGSVLSNVDLDMAAMTYVIAVDSHNATISSADDMLISMAVHNGTDGQVANLYYDLGTQDFQIFSGAKTNTSTSNFGSNRQSFIVTSNSDLCVIYRNGVAEGSVGSSDWFSTGAKLGDFEESGENTAFVIGEGYRGANGSLTGKNFDGNIYEIMIFNKALSQLEVAFVQRYLHSKINFT